MNTNIKVNRILITVLIAVILIGTVFMNGSVYAANNNVTNKPVASITSGSVVEKGSTITLSSPGSDKIYYTLNESKPTKSSKLYSKPLIINSKTTIKAIAIKSGYKNSEVLTLHYYTPDTAAKPVFDYKTHPLQSGIKVEKSIKVKMRDGIKLNVNIYRPEAAGKYPVIFSMTPYGIDNHNLYNSVFGKINNWNLGHMDLSDETMFEAPDPGYWVPKGYVVINIDMRGQGLSEGFFFNATEQNNDWYDIMDWAVDQEWSTGDCAISGVSFLCMTQWNLLSTGQTPPHLKAIVAWAGINETGQGMSYGGIPELGFGRFAGEKLFGPATSPNGTQKGTPEYLKSNLDVMDVPALVCATFSDQEMHDRDSFEAFKRMKTEDKWLYVHRGAKWENYYTNEAVELQAKFLDKYLKHNEKAMDGVPRVRYQINEDRNHYKVTYAKEWPIEGTKYTKEYLDASTGNLVQSAPKKVSTKSFTPEKPASNTNSAIFDYKFDKDTNIVGYMKLKVYVEALKADDVDLFVGIQKLDKNGDMVYMLNGESGAELFRPVALGWQRASSRALDPKISTEYNPVRLASTHPDTVPQKLSAGVIVPVNIAIMPSGTLFKKGETLRVVVQSEPIKPLNTAREWDYYKKGKCRLYSGGQYKSYLLMPEVPSEKE
jgi:predicted acyl esterase